MHSRLASAVEYVAYFSCEDREHSFCSYLVIFCIDAAQVINRTHQPDGSGSTRQLLLLN